MIVRQKFTTDKVYFLRTGPWNIPLLSHNDIVNIDKHAGALSHFREKRIENSFTNLTKTSNNSHWDFEDDNGARFDQRNCKDGVANLCPSYTKGIGRTYSATEHSNKLRNEINGYIITMSYDYRTELIIPLESWFVLYYNNIENSPIKTINKEKLSKYLCEDINNIAAQCMDSCIGNDDYIIPFSISKNERYL
jgi:hypothetical protein